MNLQSSWECRCLRRPLGRLLLPQGALPRSRQRCGRAGTRRQEGDVGAGLAHSSAGRLQTRPEGETFPSLVYLKGVEERGQGDKD